MTGVISGAVMKDPAYSVPMSATRRVILTALVDTEMETLVNPITGEIIVAQNKDKTLGICFRKLPKARKPPKPKKFFKKNNLLYRRAGNGE